MDPDPPAYEAIESSSGKKVDSWDPYAKIPTRLSLRDEVSISRSQHVAALVAQLLPHIRARAQQGLSKTSILVLPSDTANSTKGQLVGFPEDMMPIVIQLEGGYDGTQFWTQEEVIGLLREQTLAAAADQMPRADGIEDVTLPVRPEPVPRPYFWGRKQSKVPAPTSAARPTRPSVTVDIEQDQFSFRAETQYGLFETLRARAVLVTVDVK